MIEEEGLENVFARHRRLANATRACVRHWGQDGGVEIWSQDAEAASDSLTSVLMPAGHDADRVRAIASERYGVALGRGLAALQGRIFRIGHMGDLNEPMLLGALGAIELALADAGVPHVRGGVEAAMEWLRTPAASGPTRAQLPPQLERHQQQRGRMQDQVEDVEWAYQCAMGQKAQLLDEVGLGRDRRDGHPGRQQQQPDPRHAVEKAQH
jgi:hypothetical protein